MPGPPGFPISASKPGLAPERDLALREGKGLAALRCPKPIGRAVVSRQRGPLGRVLDPMACRRCRPGWLYSGLLNLAEPWTEGGLCRSRRYLDPGGTTGPAN